MSVERRFSSSSRAGLKFEDLVYRHRRQDKDPEEQRAAQSAVRNNVKAAHNCKSRQDQEKDSHADSVRLIVTQSTENPESAIRQVQANHRASAGIENEQVVVLVIGDGDVLFHAEFL